MDWGRRIERVVKGTMVATVFGGSIYGAYRLWKWRKNRKALPAAETFSELPAAEEEEEEI